MNCKAVDLLYQKGKLMGSAIFERVEQKYRINQYQKNELISFLKNHLSLDPFCNGGKPYSIANIYLDNVDSHLIQKSLLKPKYKEKFRLRKYKGQNGCYFEIKKKYNGIVSKRRIQLSDAELEDWLEKGNAPFRENYLQCQIVRELDYLLGFYQLKKVAYVAYDRIGYYDNNSELRVTFDSNLRYRNENLNFDCEEGNEIIPKGEYLLEIKNNSNLPLWLISELERLKIYPLSFSKIGTSHLLTIKEATNYAN